MCGIFGQINNKYNTFDYKTFCTLGMVNDVRGGDSVGIFIDGNYEYGIDKIKHFENFMCSSKLLEKTEKCKIAFGHCRKTSIGVTSLETAQPVLITKNNKIEYVLMHNGTIYNIEELAKKYIPEIDIKGMSDSQVMAHIFYAGHYEALEEYNGSAVFAIADYRNNNTYPKILFFKGASKKNELSKEEDDERPFYFTNDNNTLFFSSIDSILAPIFKNKDIFTIESNILIEFKDNKLHIVKKYDRTKCYQTKITTFQNLNYYNSCYCDNYNYSNYPTLNTPNKQLPEPYNKEIPEFSSYMNLTQLKEWMAIDVDFDLLYYQSNKNNLLQGGINISSAGYVSPMENGFYKKYWFWQGILLKNKLCFDFLLKLQYDYGIDEEEVLNLFPEMVIHLSVLPFYLNEQKNYIEIKDFEIKMFDGKIAIPFSKKEIIITNGKEVETRDNILIQSGSAILEEYENYNPYKDDEFLKYNM